MGFNEAIARMLHKILVANDEKVSEFLIFLTY